MQLTWPPLPYQNRRAECADALIKHLINRDFANRNLTRRRERVGALAGTPVAAPASPAV